MDPRLEAALLVNRREWFGTSACGLGTAALAMLLARDGLSADTATARPRIGGMAELPHFAPKAKHIIYLFQNGAPTHVDLFDYKPKLQELHGQPVPDSAVAGKRFSTMTGSPQGKLLLAPVEPFKQHGNSGAWVSNFCPIRRPLPTSCASSRACTARLLTMRRPSRSFSRGGRFPGGRRSAHG